MAIRLALGAPRARLLRLLLTESLLLALAGGAAGLALAYWAMRAFISFSPANVPRTDEIRLDGMALLFTFGITLLTSVAFGQIGRASCRERVAIAVEERPDKRKGMRMTAEGS